MRIGAGGNAVVFRARQAELDRDVVVKVLNALDGEATRRRFDRERRAMGRLSQAKGIAPLYDSGFTPQGQPYLLMPFYERGSLQDWIETTGPLTADHVRQIGVMVCRAVQVAHESGVLHRDLKPANILMTRSGEPAVADFGIAHLLDDRLGASQAITMTPLYTAPEIFDGVDSGACSDIYSIGATLFALLTGRAAFSDPDGSASLLALMRRVNEGPLPDLPASTTPALGEVIRRAMSKDPSARQQSAAELADDLARIDLSGALPAKTRRPQGLLVAAVAVLVLAVAGAAGAATVLRGDPPTSPPGTSQATESTEVNAPEAAESTGATIAEPTATAAPFDLAVALDAAANALVRVEAFSCTGAQVATGVLLNDGLVVTEDRILGSPWYIDVTIAGETRHAVPQTSDAERGLAFVVLEDASGLEVVRGAQARHGDRVAVVALDGSSVVATIAAGREGRLTLEGIDPGGLSRIGTGDAVITEAGGLVGLAIARPGGVQVVTPVSLEAGWGRIPSNDRCGSPGRDLGPGAAAMAASPAIAELLTMQALSDAFANERWQLVRELEPGKAAITDESFVLGWRPLRQGFVYPVGRTIDGDGFSRWRIGLVGHETRAGNDITTLFCVTWIVDPDSLTVSQTDQDSVTVLGPQPNQPQRSGFVDPADLQELIDQNCPLG